APKVRGRDTGPTELRRCATGHWPHRAPKVRGRDTGRPRTELRRRSHSDRATLVRSRDVSDATPSPWRPRAIATLVVLATTLFLFAPLAAAVAEGEHAYFEWDVSEQYWPDLVYLCSALHEGELPLWNP